MIRSEPDLPGGLSEIVRRLSARCFDISEDVKKSTEIAWIQQSCLPPRFPLVKLRVIESRATAA